MTFCRDPVADRKTPGVLICKSSGVEIAFSRSVSVLNAVIVTGVDWILSSVRRAETVTSSRPPRAAVGCA